LSAQAGQCLLFGKVPLNIKSSVKKIKILLLRASQGLVAVLLFAPWSVRLICISIAFCINCRAIAHFATWDIPGGGMRCWL
jgi:hypothetical protein